MKTEIDPVFGRVNITGITHKEFVAGMQDRTIILKILNMENALTREQTIQFNAFVYSYMFGPIVLAIIFALVFRSFMPLIGIPVAWLTSFFTTWLSRTVRALATLFLLIASVVQLFRVGIHSPSCFLVMASFWGMYWFILADRCQERSAATNLVPLQCRKLVFFLRMRCRFSNSAAT